MDLQYYAFKYLRKTRWMQSKYSGVYALFKNYDVLVSTLAKYSRALEAKVAESDSKKDELVTELFKIEFPLVLASHLYVIGGNLKPYLCKCRSKMQRCFLALFFEAKTMKFFIRKCSVESTTPNHTFMYPGTALAKNR
ncbi:hypothetical protein RvY_01233 [Ramazzottius varieornatus]|uniref:Uncharacterized protein n=1 Tax=Ramazzottius varieornatus TaxID=947166 RepID=A0A1D1ULN3_RAMVA|nr:hypothetical protein RvY_01233 [Ramazzottius varieornatus]